MKRILVLTVLALLATWSVGWAQSSDPRLQELEARLARLEQAQPTLPTHQFHMAGYMSALYHDSSEAVGTFSSSFSPLFLYRAGDRFLFESELALGFDGAETEVEMEYAQLDYMLTDTVTVVAGKFLLPFGVFGERLHPAWINKLPSPPPIYGGHGPSFDAALIPVLADFGLQVRGGMSLGSMNLNYAIYTVNGPRSMVMVEGAGHGGPGPLTLSPTAEDNTENKAMGFRVGVIPLGGLEVGASHYTGKVQYRPSLGEGVAPAADTKLAQVKLSLLDATYYSGGLRVLAEYLIVDTSQLDPFVKEVDTADPATQVTTHEEEPGKYTGYYAQVSYLHGNIPFEPVIRYGRTAKDGTELGNQVALGVNWQLESSLAVKVSYSSDDLAGAPEAEKHYIAQMTFGF